MVQFKIIVTYYNYLITVIVFFIMVIIPICSTTNGM